MCCQVSSVSHYNVVSRISCPVLFRPAYAAGAKIHTCEVCFPCYVGTRSIFVVEREQLLICEMNSWWCWLGRHRTFHKSVPARRNCVSTFNSINVLLSSYCRVNRFFFTNEFAPRRAWIVERRFFGRNLFSVLVFLSGTDAMQKAKSRDVMKFELRYAKLASLESEDIILSLLIEFCTYDLFESVHL